MPRLYMQGLGRVNFMFDTFNSCLLDLNIQVLCYYFFFFWQELEHQNNES